MIILIHLLEHLGIPSGVAIAVVIAIMKVKGGRAKLTGRPHRGPGDRRDER